MYQMKWVLVLWYHIGVMFINVNYLENLRTTLQLNAAFKLGFSEVFVVRHSATAGTLRHAWQLRWG
jgi:hypothetical protein